MSEHVCEPLWVNSFDPATGRGEMAAVCMCRDRDPLCDGREPDNPDAGVNDDEIDTATDRYERDMLGE
jgi:hypothetical protein